jgi:hypothetical protein
MEHENLTWDQLDALIVELEVQIKHSKKKYDWIIGINRGGLVPSVLLSHRLGVPHAVHTVQSYGGVGGKEKREIKSDLYISMVGQIKLHHNILVVDDISDSGDSLVQALKAIRKKDSDAQNIDVATLHYKKKSIFKPQYFAKEISDDIWVMYPWEKY